MKAVEESEAFYYKDFDLETRTYRIFNYRLCSYSEFLKPSALECRGTMFRVDKEHGTPLALVSLPLEKFFNLYENPFTMDLDLSQVQNIQDKLDGSLMSTYAHLDPHDMRKVMLKSKGSIESSQCIQAMEYMNDYKNYYFRVALRKLTLGNKTVILEWCAPDNRIVIGYEEPQLTVLAIRNNLDGSYLPIDELEERIGILYERHRIVPSLTVDNPVEFVETIPTMNDIEGYVIQLNSGQRVKIKTEWYLARHHTKDSVNNPRRLFEAVLEEATDDMRSMFHNDPLALRLIEEMEEFVDDKYNHMIDTVERFFERNKYLERKEYAILGQKELSKSFFGLAMSLYLGKNVDYKESMKKRWKEFKLKDEATNHD